MTGIHACVAVIRVGIEDKARSIESMLADCSAESLWVARCLCAGGRSLHEERPRWDHWGE